jgi:hypothetical protein
MGGASNATSGPAPKLVSFFVVAENQWLLFLKSMDQAPVEARARMIAGCRLTQQLA